MSKTPGSARRIAVPAWSEAFLAALAETSNVTAAARAADISTGTVYDARRRIPAFYRMWQQALCEGYDNLEMELLRRMREGEVKPAAGAKRGVRSHDNATAFRLLAAHRDSAARQRDVRSYEDTEAILDGINAKLSKMRVRKQAARALLTQDGSDDGQ